MDGTRNADRAHDQRANQKIAVREAIIVEGKYDDLPEQAFFMVGTIEEAEEKAKKMSTNVRTGKAAS